MLLKLDTALAALGFATSVAASYYEMANTTRYWDCCKPSCAWPGKAQLLGGPVRTCSKDNVCYSDSSTDVNRQSACDGGDAYACSTQTPWVNETDANLAYGFAAARLSLRGESDWCCACYELIFTTPPINGKRMVVQVTNLGENLADSYNTFTLAFPGGGVGPNPDGCRRQFGDDVKLGDQYGGYRTRDECEQMPDELKDGCRFRFDWFGGADNPAVNFREVTCPDALIARTLCQRCQH